MASEKINALIEEVKALTVLELSELVHALEEEFGKKLLIRGKRRITLTQDGILFRKRAAEIISLVDKPDGKVSFLHFHRALLQCFQRRDNVADHKRGKETARQKDDEQNDACKFGRSG